MKKILLISVLVAVVLLAVGLITTRVLAQEPTPTPTAQNDDDVGDACPAWDDAEVREHRCGGFGGQPEDGIVGPLHKYMTNALAKAFDLTPEELEAAREAGKTMLDIAEEQDLTVTEFRDKMSTARAEALAAAVEDGAITQKQADWMQQRLERGQRGGHCGGGFGMRGRRFFQQP